MTVDQNQFKACERNYQQYYEWNKDENVDQIRQREDREKERERKKGKRRDIERKGEIRERDR